MKRFTTIILVFILVVASATPCHARKHNTRTHVRYASGSWYCYDANTRLLYIETDDGNLWTVKTDWTQFNRMRVKVKFDTRNTKRVTDDRIVQISLIK
jgi:hypothetical protein